MFYMKINWSMTYVKVNLKESIDKFRGEVYQSHATLATIVKVDYLYKVDYLCRSRLSVWSRLSV